MLSLALALALLGEPAAATPTAPVAKAAELPFSVQFDLPSKITGRTYRIYIATPPAPAPPGGYPVVYVLDGAIAFPVAATQTVLRAVSGGKPAVVVGIAYPNPLSGMVLRNRDLTPSQPSAWTLKMNDWKADPDRYGGADGFHRMMVEELRPAVAAMTKVDPSDQSLIGYSLGGLFALHVLFQHPDAYRTVVAGSPSIWWNEREVLKDEPAFAAAVRAGKARPRILITSDGWEQGTQGLDLPPEPEKRAMIASGIAAARMVDNARELAERLKALPGGAGYEVRYALFADETHNTGIPAAVTRGVTFALAR